MKPSIIPLYQSQRGNVLLATLIFAGVVGLMLASTLSYIQTRFTLASRSLVWNSAIPVLEAGIEEAFTHLKVDGTTLTANGWAAVSADVYRKSRSFPDTSYYTVTISNATVAPVIISEGFVPAPFGRGYISRQVQVETTTKGGGYFGNALLSRSTINLGGDFKVNSFNSSDPNYSTNGLYDAATVKATGDISSMSTAAGAIQIGNSKIFGRVMTTPTGSYIIGAAGIVGDHAFQSNSGNAGQVQTGYAADDLNLSIADAPVPDSTSWWTASPVSFTWTDGVTYAYVLFNGNFKLITGTTLKGNLLVLGQAQLYVPQDCLVQFDSTNVIKIVAGASLKIHNASNTDAVFGELSNDSALASRLSYWGLPTTAGSKLTMTGGANFAATIYAPRQQVVLTGGGIFDREFVGACLADSITVNGRLYLHYDEQLGGWIAGTITSYREL
jgi:hypothetical protein